MRDVFRIYQSPDGEAAALQGLTLAVGRGELVVVFGPSGSGKTTLLRILAGLERASAGQVRVDGTLLGALAPRQLAAFRARGIGVVNQHYNRSLPQHLTCREAVGQQLELLGADRVERQHRASQLLDRIGLADAAEAAPWELSGGEQQRIAVCAAIAHRPALLLADEPAGELDTTNAGAVYLLIRELADEEHSTVLLVSHDPAAARVGDRVAHIRDGRLSEETTSPTSAEAIVVGHGGWLRIPPHVLTDAGITSHARLEREPGRVVLTPTDAAPRPSRQPATPERPRPEAPTIAGSAVAELVGVDKAFGTGRRRRTVFTNLTHRFDRTALNLITGRSGTGKTTLLRLLAGIDHPTHGQVTVLSQPLAGRSRHDLAAFRRTHIGYVSQAPTLPSFLTAAETVSLGASIRGTSPNRADKQARLILSQLGLAARLDHNVNRLSAGERQRVAIARALVTQPELLLIDEPTARLDRANARTIAALLRDLIERHAVTIICATHDQSLTQWADHETQL
jgi:ABC-type lipoprotein export system ATPase subunit